MEERKALSRRVGAPATARAPGLKRETTSDYEEGQCPSDESDGGGHGRHGSKTKNFRYVSLLRPFERVNPNMPISRTNQRLAICRGIDRRSVNTIDEKVDHSADTPGGVPAGEGQTTFRLCDFDKVEKIGEGTFGKVYKAEYRDATTGKIRMYALKKLNMIMDEMQD